MKNKMLPNHCVCFQGIEPIVLNAIINARNNLFSTKIYNKKGSPCLHRVRMVSFQYQILKQKSLLIILQKGEIEIIKHLPKRASPQFEPVKYK